MPLVVQLTGEKLRFIVWPYANVAQTMRSSSSSTSSSPNKPMILRNATLGISSQSGSISSGHSYSVTTTTSAAHSTRTSPRSPAKSRSIKRRRRSASPTRKPPPVRPAPSTDPPQRQHRQDPLRRHPGRAVLLQLLPANIRHSDEHPVSHPLRDRPGPVLPPHARCRTETQIPKADAAALEVLPCVAGPADQDERVRPEFKYLHERYIEPDQVENQSPRILGRAGDGGGAPQARWQPRRGCRISVPWLLP